MRKPTRRQFLKYTGITLASAAGLGGYGWLSSTNLRVERSELQLPRWDADGFRVAVLADLHANTASECDRARMAAELAIAEKPDVILIAGDFVNAANAVTLGLLVRALEPLSGASCPIIGVLGNHDYWSLDPHAILDRIRMHSNVKMLRNAAVEVAGVTIAGVDDAIEHKARPAFVGEIKNRNVVALLHEPDFVDIVPPNTSLQISGHSHGGQICWPGGKPMHLPGGGRRYFRGFYADAHVPLYVTRGVGTVGPDVRAFCPPEVSILTLRSMA